MNKLSKFLLRMVLFSNLSSQHRNDAKILLAFSQWIADKRYLEVLSQTEAARAMGVSKEQLAFFCSDRLGKNFSRIRKELRIAEACRILKRLPDTGLELLGEMVGIPDKSNFRKQFIEVVGQTPRSWLENNVVK